MDSVEGKRKSDICQPCQEVDECTSTKADGLCRDCKEYMCRTCFDYHTRAKYCRTHVMIDLSKAEGTNTSSGDVERCEKHLHESVRFYCRKHDLVGCGDCMLFDGHNSCHVEYIHDISLNFHQKEEFKHMTEKLDTLKYESNDIAKNVQKNMDDNTEMNKQCVDDIKSFRGSIDICLDKAETEILSLANKKCSQNANSLQQLENDFHAVESDIENYRQMFSYEKYSDRVLFIHSVLIKRKLQLVEDAIKRMKALNKFIHFKFRSDTQLNDIATTSKSLGTFINVSQEEIRGKSNKLTEGATGTTVNVSDAFNKTKLKFFKENCRKGKKRGQFPRCAEGATGTTINVGYVFNNTKLKVVDENCRKETSTVYQIFVETDTGRKTIYSVTPAQTVRDLKEKIQYKEGIPVKNIVLSIPFTGKLLLDTMKISDYYIHTGSVLLLHLYKSGSE